MSHHIAKLERMGAVKKVKVGRNVRIELTPLGVFLVKGADFVKPNFGGVGWRSQPMMERKQ